MVSIIVPIYNVEKYLKKCIESIISQTYKNIESILVDDGSTDTSGNICDEYSAKDNRVKVIHKENVGVCSARNVGLKNITGEFCMFVDGDDAIHPQLIESSLGLLKKNQLDCVVYGYRIVEESKFFSGIEHCDIAENTVLEIMSQTDALKTILIGKKFRMMACNKLYKTELWEGICFPEGRKYGDDTSVTYRILDKCNRIGYINKEYYYYCMREGSALHTRISETNLQLFDAYNELAEYMTEHHNDLMDWVYYAYAVRIFDFFGMLKKISNFEKNEMINLLNGLFYKTEKYVNNILKIRNITIKQKILLVIFKYSRKFFWTIYKS